MEVVTLTLEKLGLKLTTITNENENVGREMSALPIKTDYNLLTLTKIEHHQKTYYMNHWLIMNDAIKKLWLKCLQEYPQTPVSKGTLFALMPFYIRAATSKDLALCVSKTHLHAQLSIQDLIVFFEAED